MSESKKNGIKRKQIVEYFEIDYETNVSLEPEKQILSDTEIFYEYESDSFEYILRMVTDKEDNVKEYVIFHLIKKATLLEEE